MENTERKIPTSLKEWFKEYRVQFITNKKEPIEKSTPDTYICMKKRYTNCDYHQIKNNLVLCRLENGLCNFRVKKED